MNVYLYLLAAVSGYFLGSISFARLVTHWVSPKTNLRNISYANSETGEVFRLKTTSATTASSALGWRYGCVISILDMLKVALPTLAFRLVYPGEYYFLVAAVFGMVGNNWPVYYRFKGGAGLSALYGGLAVIDPLAIPVTIMVGLVVGMLILRSAVITFPLCLALIIPWMWLHYHNPVYLAYAVAINVLYLATLIPELVDIARSGKLNSFNERDVLSGMPMGRGMLRMIDRLNALKIK
jgi:acyl phosphate:glycerol-3-phosphate acyltransferase